MSGKYAFASDPVSVDLSVLDTLQRQQTSNSAQKLILRPPREKLAPIPKTAPAQNRIAQPPTRIISNRPEILKEKLPAPKTVQAAAPKIAIKPLLAPPLKQQSVTITPPRKPVTAAQRQNIIQTRAPAPPRRPEHKNTPKEFTKIDRTAIEQPASHAQSAVHEPAKVLSEIVSAQAAKTMPAVPPTRVIARDIMFTNQRSPADIEPASGEESEDMEEFDLAQNIRPLDISELSDFLDITEPVALTKETPPKSNDQNLLVRLDFNTAEKIDLSTDMKTMLRAYAGQIKNDGGNTDLEILAYADGDDMSDAETRRISLSRALAVHEFLLIEDIDPKRLHVRALGNSTVPSANHVDIRILN